MSLMATPSRMPIQIIGASREHERVASFAALVERELSTVRVGFPWYVDAAAWTGKDAEVSEQVARAAAEKNATAIRLAEVVVFLVPEVPSAGSWAEFGMAVALGKRVLMVGPHARQSIHRAHLCVEEVVDGDMAVACLAFAACSYLEAFDVRHGSRFVDEFPITMRVTDRGRWQGVAQVAGQRIESAGLQPYADALLAVGALAREAWHRGGRS